MDLRDRLGGCRLVFLQVVTGDMGLGHVFTPLCVLCSPAAVGGVTYLYANRGMVLLYLMGAGFAQFLHAIRKLWQLHPARCTG